MSNNINVQDHLVALGSLKAGECALIDSYLGDVDMHHRLREMGLVKGTRVKVNRFAPLGDPMELLVRGYRLSIRKIDAMQIMVSKA
ncbi:MAG: FeoA family protein [Chlamydiota bacterium]|nr:FeoA family protein [Chlamydiota bacterium]